MTTSFADFVATQDARNTIELNVRKYSLMLCDALVLDYTSQHPDSDPYKFYIESGRKYHKIIMETNGGSPVFMPLLIRKLVLCINLPVSRHLLSMNVSTC